MSLPLRGSVKYTLEQSGSRCESGIGAAVTYSGCPLTAHEPWVPRYGHMPVEEKSWSANTSGPD